MSAGGNAKGGRDKTWSAGLQSDLSARKMELGKHLKFDISYKQGREKFLGKWGCKKKEWVCMAKQERFRLEIWKIRSSVRLTNAPTCHPQWSGVLFCVSLALILDCLNQLGSPMTNSSPAWLRTLWGQLTTFHWGRDLHVLTWQEMELFLIEATAHQENMASTIN